jgi:nitrogen fixation/metabolism regulation signal transduction histidine kinase
MTGDYDWQIRNEVETSRKLQEEMLKELKESRRVHEKIVGELLKAFNKVAEELRLLREELAPKKLDKPANQSPLKNSGE